MIRRTSTSLATLLLMGLAACADSGAERAAYLTLMGNDTLAAEWMEFGDGWVEAQALVRGSRTTYHHYRMDRDEAGRIVGYHARIHAGGSPEGAVIRTEELVEEGDSLVMVITQDGQESRLAFNAGPGAVPFVDMLHWPFESALRWEMGQKGEVTGPVTAFTSRRAMEFAVEPQGDGSVLLVHPSRGPSTVHLDSEGRIMALDGTGSTRAYDLRRTTWEDLDRVALGSAFADRPLGELSGRGEIDDVVAGVHFTGHYGTPRTRGRDIFGSLLAYGVWWRTGANQATHFSLDGDIVIDGERIPAGDYTLSSIPEEDGGVLIINRMTGQGGQSYDASMDQARVQLRRDVLTETVEEFEIRVVPAAGGGRIELRWDDTVYWVPFTRP